MNDLKIIGRAESVNLTVIKIMKVPARIDTGAKTSSIWASNITEDHGVLSFQLFGKESTFYTGETITTKRYKLKAIASSNGQVQQRYIIKLTVEICGIEINASFSLADRSTLVYPMLIGRKLLSGKFLVDVRKGKPLVAEEAKRSKMLQAELE